MRIEKVSDNKIKVMIDSNEAKAWNVSFKSISENTPQAREMFWTVIRLAEKNVDFSVGNAKLFVEAVRAEDGFGMMITRVCSESELKTAISNCSYQGQLKRTKLQLRSKSGPYLYGFREFEAVCKAAEEIAPWYWGASVLYQYNNLFYLYLAPEDDCSMDETVAVLSEFGFQVQNGQFMHGRLNEYGKKMIAQGAVEVMQQYFCMQ